MKTFLEFEELPSSQPGALMDNSDDDIFSEEWWDNTGDDPDYTPDVIESPMSSESSSSLSIEFVNCSILMSVGISANSAKRDNNSVEFPAISIGVFSHGQSGIPTLIEGSILHSTIFRLHK